MASWKLAVTVWGLHENTQACMVLLSVCHIGSAPPTGTVLVKLTSWLHQPQALHKVHRHCLQILQV